MKNKQCNCACHPIKLNTGEIVQYVHCSECQKNYLDSRTEPEKKADAEITGKTTGSDLREELSKKIIKILEPYKCKPSEFTEEADVVNWGILTEVLSMKLSCHLFNLLQSDRAEMIKDIIKFIEGQSGKSGRKEIIKYIKAHYGGE